MEVELTLEEYSELIHGAACYYCGCNIKKETGSGLDRVDSNCGYSIDNVRVACKYCNHMKWHMSEEEFYKHLVKVLENQQK